MSINLEKAYFKKLEEYVGKKLNIVSNKNEITIIYDVETSYVLQEEKEIFYFYCIQRNERIKIAEYYSEKEMEYREFKYTPNLKRPISIIDPETAEEIKPVLYFDKETNEVRGKCKLKPYKSYFAFEIREDKVDN